MDKNRVSVDYATFKFLYGKYKEFTIPFIVMLVCTVVLIAVIAPQFQNLLDLSRKSKESEKNLEVLKNNFDILSSLDENDLDSQLKIVSLALPVNKDFIGIINAITYASSLSGVGVEDFQLSVGELSGSDPSSSKLSTTSVSLAINGDIEEANRFISELAGTLPLSEVTSINAGASSSTITVIFHHKPFSAKKSQGFSPIVPILSTDATLINKLANFNYVASYEYEPRLHPEGGLR